MLFYTLTNGSNGEDTHQTVRAHATEKEAKQHVRKNREDAEIISEEQAREIVGNEIDFLFAGQGIQIDD